MTIQVRYIPVPEAAQMSSYAAWYKTTYPDRVLALCPMSADGLVTADNAGYDGLPFSGNFRKTLGDRGGQPGEEHGGELAVLFIWLNCFGGAKSKSFIT